MAMVFKKLPHIEVLSCTGPFEFKPHIHDRYVIWLNTGCGEHYEVKGARDILQPGWIGIFEPGLTHANRPCSGRRHLRSFYVAPCFLDSLAAQVGAASAYNFNSSPVKDKGLWDALAGLHRDILQAPGDPALATPIQTNPTLETRILETFISLITRHGHPPASALGKAPDTCDGRVRRAVEYFRAHLDRHISLQELAGLVGCTPFHLIRLFKAHKGIPPHALLKQMRLEAARNLINQGRSLARTALDAGFSDQSHLTRAFKARYGLTPDAYRRQS